MTWDEIELKIKTEIRGEFICREPQLKSLYVSIGAMRLNDKEPFYYFQVKHGEKWWNQVTFHAKGVEMVLYNMRQLEYDASLWEWREQDMTTNDDLAVEADVALYNALFENKFAPIFITVMNFCAEVRISDPSNANTGGGVIRLRRAPDDTQALDEIKFVTDWLVSNDELWQGFLDSKLIETYTGVVG